MRSNVPTHYLVEVPRLMTTRGDTPETAHHARKSRIHSQLVERLDLNNLKTLPKEQWEPKVRAALEVILTEEGEILSAAEKEWLIEDILNEVFGLGPLEPLLKDPTVSDILVNTHEQVYVERYGRLYKTDIRFDDSAHLRRIIDRIVSAVGRRLDESSPMVDARLPDGSRVNAIIPPLAIDGPILSIRRFGKAPFTGQELVEMGTLTESMLEVLKAGVRAGLSMLISGGTGAGKTTLLNALSQFIPTDQRIITIEDIAELQLYQEHVVRLETRPPNIEGKGAIRQRHLVMNALRMRPDRIIVGEVRGDEAVDMLQAMNTGHDGSLTTIHANGPRDALSRLETMAAMANLNIPERAVRAQIASAIQIVIQMARLGDGTRKIVNISEITGMEGSVIAMQEIFAFERDGIGERGRVLGRFKATGIRPRFADRLKTCGIGLLAGHFEDSVGACL